MVDQVHPAEFASWLAQHTADGAPLPVVLDVREPWELQTASVRPQGFELIALPMGSIPGNLAALPSGRPIACLCHHGARSMRVAAFLAQNGFSQAVNIAGGIDAWSMAYDSAVPRY
jgi:rhodanese-related sulfurtransferase